MATTTVFRNFSEPVENKALLLLMKEIQGGAHLGAVTNLRMALAEGREEEARAMKNGLPAFTPHGTFKEGRTGEQIDNYSGFVHLDFDKLSAEELERAFAAFVACSYTAFCFRSPSGNGLKVFVEVTSGIDDHAIAYQQVQGYYEELSGLKADPKCKDLPRLCFVSYDPELWKNLAAEKYPVHTEAKEPIVSPPIDESDYSEAFQACVRFTEQVKQYKVGSRNEFVYTLASNCNRKGLPEDAMLELALDAYRDLPQKEIKAAFRSAYRHHSGEHAKFAKFASGAKPAATTPLSSEPDDDYLLNTPTFPDEVFEHLPELLRKGAEVFPDRRKRDVFLSGALSILSGCLPEVTGVYHQERVYPQLCCFITAPAASGKGVLKNAKRLAEAYHKQVVWESMEAAKQYEQDEEAYKQKQRSGKKRDREAPSEKPNEPAFKVVFIPADCSMARMVDHLYQNGGSGIICETEADTMSGAKKQDWGDYSHMLRQAFHHETISISRKTGNEYKEVESPRIAVALSGTPAQVPKLISSAEDGLFSRFLFYAYRNQLQWQDPSPVNRAVVYNDHFEGLSKEVLQLVGFLKSNPTEVELTGDQWAQLNSQFTAMLSEVATFVSQDASSTVLRLGLILFRLCMIFTALRKYEAAEQEPVMYCSDVDFGTALAIIDVFLQHAILMFNNLPKQEETADFVGSDGKRKFFVSLPAEFSRKEAVEAGKAYRLSARTVDGILRTGLGTHLEKVKDGLYRKVAA